MPPTNHAFARIEALAVIAALALLGSIVLPALASTKSRSQNAQCLNNLRLMGRGVQVWMSDHDGQPSWRTPLANGGTLPVAQTKPGLAWFEYLFMSNQLVTPKILACPADEGVKTAPNFSTYFTVGFREAATSYILNLHADAAFSDEPLFADRNLKIDAYGANGCIARVNNCGTINLPSSSSSAGWTNNIHGPYGNVVYMGGNASETTSAQFLGSLPSRSENGGAHFLMVNR